MTIFRYETDMREPVIRWLRARGMVTKSEFPTPWGVCDLVGAALNPDRIRRRLSQHQRHPLGPPGRIALLLHIPDIEEDTYVTLPTLARQLAAWLTPQQLSEELSRLVSWHYVSSPRRNSYQKINGWLPLHERIVAVELKLSRVEDAFAQAVAHTKFASESLIALPARGAQRLADSHRRQQLEKAGIGLLAVSQHTCQVLLEPRASPGTTDPIFSTYCAERFWRRWPKDSSA